MPSQPNPAAPSRPASPPRVLVLYGTRPEAIKMAPVIAALRARPRDFAVTVCTTAQHREMLDQVHAAFGIAPDVDLDLMRPDQPLNQLAARAFAAVDEVLVATVPDWVLVQGDTTTTFVGAMAAFNRRVRVGHVEAGLRTGDLGQPFPEEANRRVVDVVATVLFAPTPGAASALPAEGVARERVHVTGNTGVDALLAAAARLPPANAGEPPTVLVTLHRRETFGTPLAGLLAALRELAGRCPEVRWIWPLHPNPNVGDAARAALAGLPNVQLLPPFDYLEMVRRLRDCRLVLTDSGGLQEEAPTFGKPVLVLRATTERPEGVAAGVARLVGTDPQRVVAEAAALLAATSTPPAASVAHQNPYGDGRAAGRIVAVLAGEVPEPWPHRAVDPQPIRGLDSGAGGEGPTLR
jgi:UDP-N-acetylglucosamine 2-epimerase (non-hydrolysing)